MGGNVKDAMTDEPKVTRECNHCGSDFEDTVKYGPERHCTDCKEKFDSPEYVEASVELDFNEDGNLVIETTLKSTAPDNLTVRLPGKQIDKGILFADMRVESDTGWYEDVLFSDEKYMYHELKVHGSRTETLGIADEEDSEIRETNREKHGEVLASDDLNVTVEFYCSEMEDCTATLTTPEAVAKNI